MKLKLNASDAMQLLQKKKKKTKKKERNVWSNQHKRSY